MPNASEKPDVQHHVACLDGLRGVAALAVLAHHSEFRILPFTTGYLAVDFFFCLSGYVIGLAYERRLAGSLTLGAYMALRLERLWPMLLVGAVLGLCTIRYGEPDGYFIPYGHYSLALAFACQILFVPFVISKSAYVLNGAQWSILFELIVNFIHGAFVRYLTSAIVIGIIIVSGISLAMVAKKFGYINFGFGSDNFFLGLPRVGFSFFIGLMLYRTSPKWRSLVPDLGFVWLALVLIVALGLPDVHRIGFYGAKRDLGVALLLVPLVVALGSRSSSEGRLLRWLGAMSYPLYAVHGPLLLMAFWFKGQVSGSEAILLIADALIILFALLLGLFVDEPLNRLRKRTRRRASL